MSPKETGWSDRRFVILRHADGVGEHFDLMIENGERLATWKFPSFPDPAVPASVLGQRIGEHRRIYLEYEGPISNDRGEVTREDEGNCRIEAATDSLWVFDAEGSRFLGKFELRQSSSESDEWLLRRVGI